MMGCHFQADSWISWFPLSCIHSLSLPRTLSVSVSHRSRACGPPGPGEHPQKPPLCPMSLPRPGGQVTQEASPPLPGPPVWEHFLKGIRCSNMEGLELGPHTRVHCSATFCKPRFSVPQAPGLPSIQKHLEGVEASAQEGRTEGRA